MEVQIRSDTVTLTGYVSGFDSAADNEDTEESLDLLPTKNANAGICLYESDISSIEIID